MAKAKRRPRPRSLTRDRVIEAALELIDRDGADSLTMRRLADAAGVTPMALCNHVSGKQDLLRAVAAHVLDNANVDGGLKDWRAQVEFCFRAFRAICLRHPGLARLLETADVAPAAVFIPMDVTVRALEQAGLSDLDGVRTYFTLVGFTLAQTAYQSRGPYADLEPSEKIRSERLAGRGYTAIEQLSLPEGWDFDAAFEFGLRLILDGVETAIDRRR